MFTKNQKLNHKTMGKVVFERYLSDSSHAFVSKTKNSDLFAVAVADLKSSDFKPADFGLDNFDDGELRGKSFDENAVDPIDLISFVQRVAESARIVISTSPKLAQQTIAEVAKVMNIEVSEAAQYVSVYTDKTNSAKYDVVIPNTESIKGFDHKLGIYFNANGKMNQKGFEVQISSRGLAEFLMKSGFTPDQAALIRMTSS